MKLLAGVAWQRTLTRMWMMIKLIKVFVFLSLFVGWTYYVREAGHRQGVIDGEKHCDFTVMLLRDRVKTLEYKLMRTNTYIIKYFRDKNMKYARERS